MFQYNDNELLYQITEQNDDEAYTILINKYQPLILSKINKFQLGNDQKDEFYSEGLIALEYAIRKYDINKKMSFNHFFDLLLQNKFIDLIRKYKRYEKIELKENLEEYVIDTSYIENSYLNENKEHNFSKLEEVVFYKKFIENKKPKDIAIELNCSAKQVYDTICRIRKKVTKL